MLQRLTATPIAPKKAAKKAAPAAGRECCIVALPQVAERLGVSVLTLRRRQAEGEITPVRPACGRRAALYDLVAVARAILGAPDDAAAARTEKDSATAELTRLRIDRERGTLIPRDAATRAGVGICRAATTRLLRVRADLERGGVASEAVRIAGAAIDEALDDLSRLEALADEATA